jgi:ketosteroid isomerase-like protein
VSRENVELVRSGIEALRDEGWPALVSLLDPEFEFTTPADLAMEPDTYRGEEGLRRYFESFEDAMEDIRIVPQGELLDGGDKVFLPFKLTARGKETGIEAEQHAFLVWTLRDGKALRLEIFASRLDALKAAGLSTDT